MWSTASWGVALVTLLAAIALFLLEGLVPKVVLHMELRKAWRLDMPWRYRAGGIGSAVEAYSPQDRRRIAALHAFLDTPYALAAGISLTTFSILLWSHHPTLQLLSEVASIATAAADVVENAAIVAILMNPARTRLLATPTRLVSYVKWVSFLLAIPLLGVGGFVYVRGF